MGPCPEKAEPSRSAGGAAAGRRGLGVSREGGAFPRCGRRSRGEKGIGCVPRRRSLPAVRAAEPRGEKDWACPEKAEPSRGEGGRAARLASKQQGAFLAGTPGCR